MGGNGKGTEVTDLIIKPVMEQYQGLWGTRQLFITYAKESRTDHYFNDNIMCQMVTAVADKLLHKGNAWV